MAGAISYHSNYLFYFRDLFLVLSVFISFYIIPDPLYSFWCKFSLTYTWIACSDTVCIFNSVNYLAIFRIRFNDNTRTLFQTLYIYTIVPW